MFITFNVHHHHEPVHTATHVACNGSTYAQRIFIGTKNTFIVYACGAKPTHVWGAIVWLRKSHTEDVYNFCSYIHGQIIIDKIPPKIAEVVHFHSVLDYGSHCCNQKTLLCFESSMFSGEPILVSSPLVRTNHTEVDDNSELGGSDTVMHHQSMIEAFLEWIVMVGHCNTICVMILHFQEILQMMRFVVDESFVTEGSCTESVKTTKTRILVLVP